MLHDPGQASLLGHLRGARRSSRSAVEERGRDRGGAEPVLVSTRPGEVTLVARSAPVHPSTTRSARPLRTPPFATSSLCTSA